jgi:hypothetical protein
MTTTEEAIKASDAQAREMEWKEKQPKFVYEQKVWVENYRCRPRLWERGAIRQVNVVSGPWSKDFTITYEVLLKRETTKGRCMFLNVSQDQIRAD